MIIETDAIVIKNFRYNDSSKIVTLYGEHTGKFSALVKGVRSIKSRNVGVFENLNLIKVSFRKKYNRDLQLLSRAESVATFNGIKSNLDCLNYAYRIIELVNKTTGEFDSDSNLYTLLKTSLLALDKNIQGGYIKVYLNFLLSIAHLHGISPDITFEGNGKYRIGSKKEQESLIISEENYRYLTSKSEGKILNANNPDFVYIIGYFERLLLGFFDKANNFKSRIVFNNLS
ncbi:MAG: DNA repair protein RecO [Ignavibacteria bacterium]